jgi:hypothetical protein
MRILRKMKLGHGIERGDVLVGQHDVDRAQRIGQLIDPLRAQKHAGDDRPVQEPCDRDLGHGAALRSRHVAHHVDGVIGAVLVEGREVEGHTPTLRRGALAVELAREEPAGERAPDHQADPFGEQHRHDLPFQVTAGEAVIGLQRDDGREAAHLGDADGLHHLPRGPVRQAEITDMAVLHERVERLQRFLDRGRRVEAVDLVEVDMVELQALQARLRLVHDMAPGGAARVRALSHLAMDLGGDDQFLAGQPEVADRLAEDLLAAAGSVDIRGVEEVDPAIDCSLHDLVGGVLSQLADLAPNAVGPAEGHGAEAKLRYEKAASAEAIVTHGDILPTADRAASGSIA